MAAMTLLAIGCSRKSSSTPPTSPTPPPAASTAVSYTAVGASDAVGVGGSHLCVPFSPCPDGTGYVAIIARQLASGRTVTLTNLGVPGAVLGPSTQALARQYGRDIIANFIENEVPFVARDSTVVTVFAGGNDANAIVAAIESGAGGGDVNGFIDQQVRQFVTDMDRLVRGIRERSSSARIVVANLPNLSQLPYASGAPVARRQMLRQLAVGFTTQGINPLVNQGVVVVDLLCDNRAYLAGNFSSDGFHPNDRGYAFMAEMLLAGINTAGFPAPSGSCAQMTAT
jgi:lysophospholipase L1-like esterase